jgi:putative ABC transport system permease protein
VTDAPRWRRYLRFWRSNIRGDVDDEFAFHIEERIDDLVARGWTPAAARAEAVRAFGDIDKLKSRVRVIAEEKEASMAFTERLTVARQDAGYALRVMRANPAFAAAITLTLALGIGATTAIFSVVNAVLLRPLPYANADRIVLVQERWRQLNGNASAGHFHDWMEQGRSFSAVSGFQRRAVNLTDGDPTRISSAIVTPSFFQTGYMPPMLGRYFLPTETEASRVVVLSWPLWQARFNSDSAIIGKEVVLSGEKHTVIGVTPEKYTLTRFDERLWTPMSFTPQQRTNYGSHWITVFALLKPGVTVAQAQADMDRVTEGIRKRVPLEMKERGVLVTAYEDILTQGFNRQLWVLLGAVSFVLLIGCANVASLLLARAMSRRKEIAIRAAIGGSRSRLVTQLLTESAMLALVGGSLGLLVAQLGLSFFKRLGPQGLPRLAEAGLQWDVLLFAGGATIVSGMIFGLAPALRATKVDLQGELRDGGRGSRAAVRDGLRSALIVAEIAVALLLMVSAGLFIRSAMRLQGVAPGFNPENVTMMRVALPAATYDSGIVVEKAFNDIVRNVQAIPGVEFAAAGTRLPMWGGSIDMGVRVQGQPVDPNRVNIGHVRIVSPAYHSALGMTLKQGRFLRDADMATGAPWVVVVNEAFVKQTFPDGNAIGKRILGWAADTITSWREIVGVVGDTRSFGREQSVPPEVFMPITQPPHNAWPAFNRSMMIVAKARAGTIVAPAMRAAVTRFDAQLPVWDLQTMESVLDQSTSTRRFNTLLLTLLGVTGLILAAIGIYGVIAYFVAQRTHEIGVRVALGASTSSVVGMVVKQALTLAALGIGLGAVASWWAVSVLQTLLFDVQPRDPVAFVLGATVLLLVTLGAAWIPARRASRVDPVMALASSG